jgi:hypothetical protein
MNRDWEEDGIYARTTNQERNRTTRASQETETAPAAAASDHFVAASLPGSTATMPPFSCDVTKQTSLKNAAGGSGRRAGRRCRGDGKFGNRWMGEWSVSWN